MLDAACTLAACGFKVLPIRAGTKEPACPHGVKDATIDDAQLARWFSSTSHAIGVSGEGFVIFDFDRHGGVDGMDALHEWEREHGELPATLAQTTPSGGYHMVYRCAEEVRPSVNTELAVDVRAWGSYIVCDPTPGYCWETDPEPGCIADADERVMAFLEFVRPKAKRKARPIDFPKKVKEGGRNDALYRLACSMQAQCYSDAEIAEAVRGYNRERCVPPLGEAEVSKVIESALELPKGHSAEVKAREARKGNSSHVVYSKRLMDERHACMIGEAPAIMSADGKSYRMGWDAITRALLDYHEGAKMAEQREVRNFIKLRAPQASVSDPHLIAFRNGVLDIRTTEIRRWEPTDVIPNVIPHDWNPAAECSDVDRVLARISAGDPFVESNLCEFAGLCMYRDSTKYGYMAILLGKQGQNASNGKSTYIQMLANMLGQENYAVLDMAILGERFQAGHILGKLANLGDDISNEYIAGSVMATVKKAVTGQEIYTDVKGGDGFKFKPYATMVFSANQMPKLGDNTEGVARRLFPIRFNARFTPSDPDFDPDIMDKLTTEAAAERLIVRAVAGLKRVLENRQPTPNAESVRMVGEIRANNSSVLQWIDYEDVSRADCIGKTPSSVHELYKQWCIDGGYKHFKAVNEFSKELCGELGMVTTRQKVDGKTRRFYAERDEENGLSNA